jgi:hypothetical protein
MGDIDTRGRYVIYCIFLGVNQLIDKGYTESNVVIVDKMINHDFINYISSKYKNEGIQQLEFTEISKKKLPEVIKLIAEYGTVISPSDNNGYDIRNNGLVLASSVLANILYLENNTRK